MSAQVLLLKTRNVSQHPTLSRPPSMHLSPPEPHTLVAEAWAVPAPGCVIWIHRSSSSHHPHWTVSPLRQEVQPTTEVGPVPRKFTVAGKAQRAHGRRAGCRSLRHAKQSQQLPGSSEGLHRVLRQECMQWPAGGQHTGCLGSVARVTGREAGKTETWLLRMRKHKLWEDSPSKEISWESCLPYDLSY